MKEIQSILQAYSQIDFAQNAAALSTVVRVEGSSYRRTGARMLVLDNGTYLGGISGGCLEGDALRRAQKAIAADRASLVTYDTTKEDDHQVGVGLGCNGIIDVLFTPLSANDLNNPVMLLAPLPASREPRAVITITGSNDKDLLGKMLLYENATRFLNDFAVKTIREKVVDDIALCFNNRQSQTFTYEDGAYRVFIEIILPVTHLVVYGGNYDLYPMVRLAKELGWKITVVTNIGKADKSLFSIATDVLDNKGSVSPAVDAYSAIMLMAHDYKTDLRNFKNALQTNAPYIGLLGPKKRAQKMLDALSNEGTPVDASLMPRIFAPAGLDIGANMPEEIALSILAEIIGTFTGRNGTSLRLRERTIHED